MLGMYDMPALQPANDRLWAAIRSNLNDGPETLDRDRDFWEIWRDPDMVFSQTCGMPFRTQLHGTVQLVGTPDYGLPNCPAGYYRSVFVAHADTTGDLAELCTGVFAYNEAVSQSGWAAPTKHLEGLGLKPAKVLQSGGHALSAQAVSNGRADFAALDMLTWVLLQEHEPFAQSLRIVELTDPTPTLPYITALGRDRTLIAAAVRAAIADLSSEDRDTLHLHGLVDIPAETYLAVPTPAAPEE